ncbi:family 43 glycosylhydrolase [Halanaerobium sp. ST460_2HS_T2]|uniref:family 43 glycosylhydrolase n=1 Tax=Halanaerobium sp. ST460_2HS_T2 TaxID=2183914 RepID=UPI000E00368F|nr:family 43 glycosylhydrolase [Halanaerobium sp. ST460_2HS_T2]RCW61900.1 GH43 family beta-xylosidase [Halanaerobium sp. ST460_2HS_T2]
MQLKIKTLSQNNILIGLALLTMLLVFYSSALASDPVIMEENFKIKDLEKIKLKVKVGEKITLPSQLKVELQQGITAQFPVVWDETADLIYREKGNYQIKGKLKIQNYPDPLIEQRADPFIYKHQDGYYYFTASYPEYDRIILRRSKTIAGLKDAEEKVIWWKHQEKEMSKHIWAPELHFINGKWYIYFAASRTDAIWAIRQYVLENDSANPLQGEWKEKGKLKMNFEEFTLDATSFTHQNQRYLVWAQKKYGDSNLYIAKLKTPWQIEGKQRLIAEPIYSWERKGFNVNEGAAVIKKGNKIFITYSASATDANYSVGLLTADQDSNLLDPDSWSKYDKAIFKSSKLTEQFGPGHNSFTVDENGNEILVYHARSYKKINGDPLYDPNRHTRVQRIFWDQNNNPVFGIPGYKIEGDRGVVAEITVE